MGLPIYGRDTGHVESVGEVFPAHIAGVLNEFLPQLGLPVDGETSRPMPSRSALCEGCPYIPTFEALLQAIEGLGGVMNANTGNEITTYWAKVAYHHLPAALDVLLDMYHHSKFEPSEVERERQVIIQEIGAVKDMPDSWVHVLIAELIWPGHPVGWWGTAHDTAADGNDYSAAQGHPRVCSEP